MTGVNIDHVSNSEAVAVNLSAASQSWFLSECGRLTCAKPDSAGQSRSILQIFLAVVMIDLSEFAPKHLLDIRDFSEITPAETFTLSQILDHLMDSLRDFRFKHRALQDGCVSRVDPNPLKEQLSSVDSWFRRVMPGKHVDLGFDLRKIARLLTDQYFSISERVERVEQALFEVEDRLVLLDLKLSYAHAVVGHFTCSIRDLSDLALAGVLHAVVRDTESLELLLRTPPQKDPIQDNVSR